MSNHNLIIAAMKATQPQLAASYDADHAYANEVKAFGARVALFRKYEAGEHRAVITEQMRRMLRIPNDDSGFNDFNLNFCSIIIERMADRLNIIGMSTKDDKVDKEWLSLLMKRSSFSALQGSTFRAAVRDSESFIMIEPNKLKWVSEPAFDGYEGMYAMCDKDDPVPYWVVKLWREPIEGNENDMCLVVYEEGLISYWRGKQGGNEVIPDVEAAQNSAPPKQGRIIGATEMTAPVRDNYIRWLLPDLPIVRVVNRAANHKSSGESELRNAITPSDVINRTLHSDVSASEFTAFAMLYAIGIPIDPNGILPGAVINLIAKDKDGKPITTPTPELAEFMKTVKVGKIEGSGVEPYLQQLEALVRFVSQVSVTPIYGITTTGALSGDALRQLEIGLTGKIKRFQEQNTDCFERLVFITAEIQKTYATQVEGEAPDLSVVSVLWQPAELVDNNQKVKTLIDMRRDAPGLWSEPFYRTSIGTLLGMDQDAIDKEGKAAEEERAKAIADVTGGDGGNPVVV